MSLNLPKPFWEDHIWKGFIEEHLITCIGVPDLLSGKTNEADYKVAESHSSPQVDRRSLPSAQDTYTYSQESLAFAITNAWTDSITVPFVLVSWSL